MKNKITVMMFLFLAVSLPGFTQTEPDPTLSAHANVYTNAKFNRAGYVFSSRSQKEARARMAAKEAARLKQEAEEAQDKGEGQVKMKF